MAQSHTSWETRGRRELLSWDGSNSSCSTVQRNTSPTDLRPISPTATDIIHPEGNCSWCGQSEIGEGGVSGHVEIQGSGQAKIFCSDICFSQCRRAAFKRAKVCDWCKHVRHTVSYVDLHDGQRQLQFCTDKCRNQYKMHLFCAEASSLGVQSCTTPVTKGETSPGTSIDPKQQSTGLLITPDLWLADCRLENSINVKLECNEETEIASIDSEPEELNSEGPLNLVHSSRRSKHSAKRKLNLVEIAEIPASKKGKSHRKIHSGKIGNTRSHQPVTPLSINQTFPTTAWPSFPYPPHVVHPSYILQSQFLALNHSLKATKSQTSVDRDQETPPAQVIEIEKSICDPSTSVLEHPVTPSKLTTDQSSGHDVKNRMDEDKKINLSSSVLPNNFVVLRIPYFIPLPIPVPIPIPLNIHEKYLKQVLTQ